VPPQTVAAPHLGAWISRTSVPLDPAVPAFINIGQRFDLGEGEELKAFTTAGFSRQRVRTVQRALPGTGGGCGAPARRHEPGAVCRSQ
jgi:hypothetical protein